MRHKLSTDLCIARVVRHLFRNQTVDAICDHDTDDGSLRQQEAVGYSELKLAGRATSVLRLPRSDPPLRIPRSFAVAPLGLTASLAGRAGLLLIGLVGLAVFVLLVVVCPAVWSKKPTRRKAALDVLRTLWRK
jgi:hypothetical protein